MVGLTNVDNTSDAAKPVSTAQQTALNLKANLANPTFTGTPSAPTAVAGTNTTQLATTAFVTTAASASGTNLSFSRHPSYGGFFQLISSTGENVFLPLADTNYWGLMSDVMFDKLDGISTDGTITVSANNSTNETVYPVFVDGATGSQNLETDTGLTYNPSTGELLACNINQRQTFIVSSTPNTARSYYGNINVWLTLYANIAMDINGFFTYLLSWDCMRYVSASGRIRVRLKFVKGGTTYYFPRTGNETESLTTYTTDPGIGSHRRWMADYSNSYEPWTMCYSNSVKIDPGVWNISIQFYKEISSQLEWNSGNGNLRLNIF